MLWDHGYQTWPTTHKNYRKTPLYRTQLALGLCFAPGASESLVTGLHGYGHVDKRFPEDLGRKYTPQLWISDISNTHKATILYIPTQKEAKPLALWLTRDVGQWRCQRGRVWAGKVLTDPLHIFFSPGEYSQHSHWASALHTANVRAQNLNDRKIGNEIRVYLIQL